MKIKEVLDKTTTFFKDKKIETARLDAELLISNTLGLQRIDLYLKFDQPLSEEELESCRHVVRRRSLGEPLAYIVGKKDFYNHSFVVNKSVLIPRPETELLVEEVLAWVQIHKRTNDKLKILDIGAGSGCIGITLLKALPQAQATFIDISSDALSVVENNAKSLGVYERSSLSCQDAFQLKVEANRYDIVVSNPPYIAEGDVRVQSSVVEFEPHAALFSKKEGLQALESWSDYASKVICSPGLVAFEFGIDQADKVKALFKQSEAFDSIKIVKDLSAFDRHIIGVRNG